MPFERAAYAREADGREWGDPSLVSGVTVRGACWLGPGARVGRGAELHDVVIGAGAEVQPGASLHEVVVWDGVEVSGRHARSIAWSSAEPVLRA